MNKLIITMTLVLLGVFAFAGCEKQNKNADENAMESPAGAESMSHEATEMAPMNDEPMSEAAGEASDMDTAAQPQ